MPSAIQPGQGKGHIELFDRQGRYLHPERQATELRLVCNCLEDRYE